MKYPKLWNGANPAGEAKVRQLQKLDAPFVRASGPGFDSRKGGERVEVFTPEEGLFLTVGYLADTDTVWTLKASPDADQLFVKRGAWDQGAFTGRNIAYLGKGYGVLPKSLGLGLTELHRTIRGASFKPLVTVQHEVTTLPVTALWLVRGALVQDAGGVSWTFGVAYRVKVGTLYSAVYAYTLDGGKTWAERWLNFPVTETFAAGFPRVQRVSPDTLLMLLPAYGNPRATAIGFLTGNGAAFTQIDPGRMVHDIPVGAYIDNLFPGWANDLGFCALANNTHIAVVGGNVYAPEGFPTGSLRIYRVGGSIIGEFFPSGSPYLQGAAPVLIGNRPVFLALTENASQAPKLFVGDVAGSVWATLAMPRPQYATGNLVALDDSTLGCPMWDTDGVYRLYQTKDLGVTWTRRATIDSKAVAPLNTNLSLGNFGTVTQLRRGVLPAHTFPGSPWVGDARIPKPWEVV